MISPLPDHSRCRCIVADHRNADGIRCPAAPFARTWSIIICVFVPWFPSLAAAWDARDALARGHQCLHGSAVSAHHSRWISRWGERAGAARGRRGRGL